MTAVNASLMPYLLSVVELLSANNAFWSRCGGAGDRSGMSLVAIETALAWDATLTGSVLRYGLRLGTLRQSAVGPNCITQQINSGQYFVNVNMLNENNANQYFTSVLSGLPSALSRRFAAYQSY